MAKIEIVVCDVCKDPQRPVKIYTVVEGARKGRATFCDEHGEVMERILKASPVVRRHRTSVTPVVSMDEVARQRVTRPKK